MLLQVNLEKWDPGSGSNLPPLTVVVPCLLLSTVVSDRWFFDVIFMLMHVKLRIQPSKLLWLKIWCVSKMLCSPTTWSRPQATTSDRFPLEIEMLLIRFDCCIGSYDESFVAKNCKWYLKVLEYLLVTGLYLPILSSRGAYIRGRAIESVWTFLQWVIQYLEGFSFFLIKGLEFSSMV